MEHFSRVLYWSSILFFLCLVAYISCKPSTVGVIRQLGCYERTSCTIASLGRAQPSLRSSFEMVQSGQHLKSATPISVVVSRQRDLLRPIKSRCIVRITDFTRKNEELSPLSALSTSRLTSPCETFRFNNLTHKVSLLMNNRVKYGGTAEFTARPRRLRKRNERVAIIFIQSVTLFAIYIYLYT